MTTFAKKLSLTFDNGPTPGITEHVLDVLDVFGVKATFFLVGEQLRQPGARRLAERALDSGHRIGNHSDSHGAPLGLRHEPGAAAGEILRAHALLGELVGSEPLYRPNGRGSIGPHLLNREALETLTSLRASVVLWTGVPRDRAVVVDRPDAWLDDAKRSVAETDWSLLVLHDRPSGFASPGPMAFLDEFLRWACDHTEFRTDFPPECVPLKKGIAQPSLGRYVADAAEPYV